MRSARRAAGLLALCAVAALTLGCESGAVGGGTPTPVLGGPGGGAATVSTGFPPAMTPVATTEAGPGASTPGGGAGGATYSSGDLRVPDDIAPGLYRSDGGEFCTWQRLRGFSGAGSDTLTGQVSNGGPEIVEILDSDGGFTSSRCGDWTPLDLESLQPRATFGDGVYVVGLEIAPGNWIADTPTNLCVWQRLSGFSGDPFEIIEIGIGDGRTVVQIQSTDRGFRSFGCGEWKPG